LLVNIKTLGSPNENRVLRYRAFPGQSFVSSCRVRIYNTAPRAVVIISELPENDGTSVTNAAQTIATLVVQQYRLDPAQTIWVEHYPDRHDQRPPQARYEQEYDVPDLPSVYGESFDVVTFVWDDAGRAHRPEWHHITPMALLETLPCCMRIEEGDAI
jgi:hypothetical protein